MLKLKHWAIFGGLLAVAATAAAYYLLSPATTPQSASLVESIGARRFEFSAFEAEQRAGTPILVQVTAPWCPTCRAQKPIVDRIAADQPRLVIFNIDFDTRPEELRRFGVRSQSTMIVFKGEREVGRATGDTDADRIRTLISRSL